MRRRAGARTIWATISALYLTSSLPVAAAPLLVPTDATAVDLAGGWHDRWTLIRSIDTSLKYLKSPAAAAVYPREGVSRSRLASSLKHFREILKTAPDAQSFSARVLRDFQLYQVDPKPDSPEVLITGYYAPIYRASLKPTATFRYPLYRKPADLVTSGERGLGQATARGIQPYPTRYEIEKQNLLAGQEIVWLADPLERFLVHVQGSARLQLTDGTTRSIGFAAKTDRPYRSIGKALVEDGKIRPEDLTLQAVKDYFKAHPDELESYLYKNDSYVFFRWTDDGGPYGSLGWPVTAMHSAAMDKRVFPPGALLFIQAELRDGPLRQFVLDQDTGAAIRGRGRLDLFVGTGPEAEYRAGQINSAARLYYLLLKNPAS
ncbi:murein transglycosylase A [Gloeobacter kilaueensis]|uniref:murein transglycosylase A n=1 Tax=Gloeobacter kilaueensis TaxID=1416614 RepID=UPI0006847094|nr:MltA domain-containing protein [Gloeobacter kilaueensis]